MENAIPAEVVYRSWFAHEQKKDRNILDEHAEWFIKRELPKRACWPQWLDIVANLRHHAQPICWWEPAGGVGLNRVTLQRLFPPLIRFAGPDDLIRLLKSPKIAGKVLTIEGLLYTGSRMLFVIGVDEGGEAGGN